MPIPFSSGSHIKKGNPINENPRNKLAVKKAALTVSELQKFAAIPCSALRIEYDSIKLVSFSIIADSLVILIAPITIPIANSTDSR